MTFAAYEASVGAGVRFLLAVDHPRDAASLTNAVATLFGGRDASAVVVHVHQVAPGRFGVATLQAERDQDCVALDMADLLSQRGVPALGQFAVTGDDDIAATLCRTALAEDASFVVVGTHPKTDSHSKPGRTLAERVQRFGLLPVLLVPVS